MARDELVDHGHEIVVGEVDARRVVLFDLDVAARVERELPAQAVRMRVVVVVDVVFGDDERPATPRDARWHAAARLMSTNVQPFAYS